MLTRLLFTHIMETKTLEIDKALYEEAQRYASSKGTDLRTLVETFLRSLLKNEAEEGVITSHPLSSLCPIIRWLIPLYMQAGNAAILTIEEPTVSNCPASNIPTPIEIASFSSSAFTVMVTKSASVVISIW